MDGEAFYQKGWCRFDFDPELAGWVTRALPPARAAVRAAEHAHWMRCGGTWFVGVNALPNDSSGAVGNSGPLCGAAARFCRQLSGLSTFEWDRAQISVCYPDYPQPMASESATALQFRRERDAAHVDGVLPEGENRRRYLREHHGFVLGIPMVEFSADACPFVIWEGSHEIIRAAMRERFRGLPADRWADEDITRDYQQMRRAVFESCKRVEIAARPGEAYVAHRLSVHGVAPWVESAKTGDDGRMICYFRPLIGGPEEWLTAP